MHQQSKKSSKAVFTSTRFLLALASILMNQEKNPLNKNECDVEKEMRVISFRIEKNKLEEVAHDCNWQRFQH
jgi:hypothetical protein